MKSKKFQKLIASFCAKPAYAGVDVDFTSWFIDNAIDILGKAFKDWASKSSIDEVMAKAEEGNAEAQYVLGLMYYFEAKADDPKIKELASKIFTDVNPTFELKKDYATALKWLRRSAEQGYPQAQFSLGNMYCNGHGTARNYSEALEWYKRAAENGFVYAEYNLGTMYRFGAGTEENSREALNWYERAAKHGSSEAQFAIGDMYYNGEGIIPQDKNEAFKWYLNSAESGYAPAQYTVGMMYRKGNKAVRSDISEAEKWLRQSAEQNHAPAQFELAEIYWRKDNSKTEGERLYLQAAENGYAPAQVVMGLDKGDQTEEGADWFRRAAEQGYAEGQYHLGRYYDDRNNYPEAMKWYLKASEQGYASAQWNLALCYQTINPNYELAYTYHYLAYLCAAEQNDDTTQSFAQSSMQELAGSLNRIFGLAKLSSSQVKKAKCDAQRMFDEIQRHKKQEKRRNIIFRSEIKEEHANVLQEMKEKEAQSQKKLLKKNMKLALIKILKEWIILGIVFIAILILAMITKK